MPLTDMTDAALLSWRDTIRTQRDALTDCLAIAEREIERRGIVQEPKADPPSRGFEPPSAGFLAALKEVEAEPIDLNEGFWPTGEPV